MFKKSSHSVTINFHVNIIGMVALCEPVAASVTAVAKSNKRQSWEGRRNQLELYLSRKQTRRK